MAKCGWLRAKNLKRAQPHLVTVDAASAANVVIRYRIVAPLAPNWIGRGFRPAEHRHRTARAEAGRRAVDDVRPISDMRASAEYRKDLVAVLAKRTLEGACALARASKQKGVRK